MTTSSRHQASLGLALAALLVALPAVAGTGTLIQSVGVTGDTPTAMDNDYTRINDALMAASSRRPSLCSRIPAAARSTTVWSSRITRSTPGCS